jgi:hypothetical protein
MDLCVRTTYRVLALFRRRHRKRSAELLGYRLGPGSDQVTIGYEQGHGDKPGVTEILTEDSHQVRVRIRYEFFDGLRLLVAIPREVVVTLKAPLHDRKLVDENGDAVPRS